MNSLHSTDLTKKIKCPVRVSGSSAHMTMNSQFQIASLNRVTKITDALTQITEFTYHPANGNLLATKDPLNHVTTIAYNSFGQPTAVQGPILSEPPTTFAYDADGNLMTTTDPLGNITQRAYDAVSRLTSLTDPRGLITQFRYDGLNRVTEIADARRVDARGGGAEIRATRWAPIPG